MRWLLPLLLACLLACTLSEDCISRSYEHDSIVCVCDATQCPQAGIITFPDTGSYTVVTSSKDGLRFDTDTRPIETTQDPSAVLVRLNRGYAYQTILGFGGAFTDSTGFNVVALPEAAQDNILKSYFAPDGIGYNLCRIPIAGSDFSVRPYSYDDVEGDVDLVYFALADEDLNWKLPLILRAKELSPQPLLLFGSPWSPPAWMKTNGKFNESGELLREMWQPWSNYFVKFVEAYEAAGADMWGLTTQNEPLSGFDENWGWNTCGWTAEDMRDWIKESLGPTLEAAGMRRLQLMVDDFNRDTLPWYVQPMLEDPECAQYVDATAVHWYSDEWVAPSVLDETKALFPDKYLLYTEACEGWYLYGPGPDNVQLGSWTRAETYGFRIMESLNHYSRGWVDWNMVLNRDGGPNWAGNYVDAPIIVNATAGEFYKQPLFYAMGHFSKWVLPDAQRIFSTTVDNSELYSVAFVDPSGGTVVVLLNTGESALTASITDESGSFLNFPVPAKSFQTILANY